MDAAVGDVDVRIQNVFANHIVLASAGYVEDSVLAALSEYGRTHGNPRIARFVEKSVSRNNSLNSEKIENILHQFDKEWWPKIAERTSRENIEAIDSLKTLRDHIAHGRHNGTGYYTVRDYYKRSKRFILDFTYIVLR
ncbi:MAG: HEPN domain-containing protein [Pseudomonadota bacterium]|nr:HEPN domain-containing protein [Pseudomonadota bacterium]